MLISLFQNRHMFMFHFVLFCTAPALFISRVTGHRLTVYVLPHDNIANLYKSYIFGLDFRGNFLNVSISKDTFHHCLCRNATDIVHIRTDPDEYGNYNDSIFHVDIIGKIIKVIPETHCVHWRISTFLLRNDIWH